MEMTDAQREIVQPILEARSPGEDPRGRKPSEQRPILEGILWILRTGDMGSAHAFRRRVHSFLGPLDLLCPLICWAT